MVTLPVPERLAFAKQSIDDYCRQTHTNKTLIVVINGGLDTVRDALLSDIAARNRSDIIVVTPPGVLNLGQLRNISLDAAVGDLICQWDDDDRVHPERLEIQAAALAKDNLEAVYLQEVMQYFPNQRAMYWMNWRATPTLGHPGTLMARRSLNLRYPTQGPVASLGEDSEFAQALMARGHVGYVTGKPYLFLYVSHGANSWADTHHTMLREQLAISQSLLQRREPVIRQGLAPYDLSSTQLRICGSNGDAFLL